MTSFPKASHVLHKSQEEMEYERFLGSLWEAFAMHLDGL